MPPSKLTYDQPPGAPSPVVKEEQIEYGFIGKLQGLKYEYPRIRYDSGGLEHSVSGDNFGVREAVCLLLEGGEEAFKARENRYSLVQI